MVPVCQYEAKKGVGGSRRYTEAESKAGSPSQEDYDMRLVGLGRHCALGNARKNATVNKELYIAQLQRVNEAIGLKRPDRQGQTILFTTTLGPMLHKSSKPHSKSSNGKFFSTRRILRTLRQPITTFSAPCQIK